MDDQPMAVLFSYDPETGERSAALYDDGPDPMTAAAETKEELAALHPERLYAVAGNEAAREIHFAGLARSAGFERPHFPPPVDP